MSTHTERDMKLYTLGDVISPTIENLEEHFEISEYKGEKDANLMITSDMLESPSSTTLELVKTAWDNKGKLVLLNPNHTAVEKIRSLLSIQRILTLNARTIEYYGLCRSGSNVIDIELHRRTSPLDTVDAVVEDGDDSAPFVVPQEEPEELKRRVMALKSWIIDPIPHGYGEPTSSQVENLFNLIDSFLGSVVFPPMLVGDPVWQTNWYAIPVWRHNPEEYWMTIWIDSFMTPSSTGSLPKTIDFVVRNVSQFISWDDLRGEVLSTPLPTTPRIIEFNPRTSPGEVITVTTSVGLSITGGVEAGTSGASVSRSATVSLERAVTKTVPWLVIEATGDLQRGMPSWRYKYRDDLRGGVIYDTQHAWTIRFGSPLTRTDIPPSVMVEYGYTLPGYSVTLSKGISIPLPVRTNAP
ncbi:MAG: hypothetical protein U7123_20310 [Potamolinea sp.]